MFTKSARFYDALYQFKDYQQATLKLKELIRHEKPGAVSLLDVACGTGKHIEYLKDDYAVEGLDLNPELLQIAGERCPGIKFHEADMIDFNLGSSFDVITCLFSSIGYVQTKPSLDKAIKSMAAHLKPGGLLIIEPWISPEKYWKGKLVANFADLDDLKISWMYIHEQEGMTSVFDIQYMVGTDKEINCFSERHVMGLWTDDEYRDAFIKSGLSVTHEEKGFFGRGVYYGILQ
jgi:ubiquinone/menaquinone biosynthesis C-methylase UbiE